MERGKYLTNFELHNENINYKDKINAICCVCKELKIINSFGFKALFCADCLGKTPTIKELKFGQLCATNFNSNNNEIKICKLCSSIKKVKHFKGAKNKTVDRCDVCRNKVIAIENNRNNLVKKSCGHTVELKNGQLNQNMCDFCHNIKQKEKDRKSNLIKSGKLSKNIICITCVDETTTNVNEFPRRCMNKKCYLKIKQKRENFIKTFKNGKVQVLKHCEVCREINKGYCGDREKTEERINYRKNIDALRKETLKKELKDTKQILIDEKINNMKVCNNRDCKKRILFIDEFIDDNCREWDNCNECRKNQRIYDIRCKSKIRENPEKIKRINKLQRERRKNSPEQYKQYYKNRRINVKDLFNSYKLTAKNKNIEFNITLDLFMKLILDDCDYCGEECIGDTENGLNGIDRVDNNIGYIEENVVSCCSICNMMKCNTNIDDFIKRVEHIAWYQFKELCPEIGDKSNHNIFNGAITIRYSDYKYKAKQRNKEFSLTEEEFNDIVKEDCYICGRENNETLNGIDRFKNNIGYVKDNCLACCATCNKIKRNYSFETLLSKCLAITLN